MGEFFVYSVFFGTFPIFVNADSYLDVRENKAWFSLGIFGLRLLGGYAELKKDGVAVHFTKKFAVLIRYDKMADTRKKFEVTKGFQLYRFRQVLETGGSESPYGALLAGGLKAASAAAFSVLNTKHPFLVLKSSTVLTEEPCLKLSVRTVTVFNGLILAVAFSKKILEAIINWISKKRSTASWKKQRSS